MSSVRRGLVFLVKHVLRFLSFGTVVVAILLSVTIDILLQPHEIAASALQFPDSIRPTPALLAKAMPITFTVDENTPNLTKIGRLVDTIQPAPSPDWRYTIPQNPYFDILPDSSLRVIGPLDRDENRQLCSEPSYPQQCVWTSFAVTGNGQYIGLRVSIQDVNDNVPSWAEPTITIHVTEEMHDTFTAELPVAKDPDLDKNGIQGYKLQTELDDAERFELIVKSSAIKSGARFHGDNSETMSSRFKLFLQVLKPLDREIQSMHNLTLLAFDGSEPYHTGRLNIIVQVNDENDHSPQFTSPAYTAIVSEDAGVGSVITLHESAFDTVRQSDGVSFASTGHHGPGSQLLATDRDVGPNGQVQYEFAASTDPQVLDLFSLDQHSGQIRVAKPLSYDIRPTGWKFQVVAKDGGRPSRSSSATVLIQLKDANTHGPDIKTRLHQPKAFVRRIKQLGMPQTITDHLTNVIYIPENTQPVLEPLAVFTVGDKDTGAGGEFDCVLTDSQVATYADEFQLNFTAKLPNWNVYSLYVRRSIDRELAPVRKLIVTCTDQGQPPRSSYEKLNVILVDENDNAPKFVQSKYQLHIQEGNHPNASVGKLRAHDPDDGPNGQVSYRILWPHRKTRMDQPFLITNEGKLIATKTLDREATPNGYRFQVIASDNGKPQSLNSTVDVEVILDDINDCTPRFLQKQYNFTIEEDYAQNFTTGRWVGQVKAVDCDLGPNGQISYMILDPGLPFEITHNGMLKTTRFIDREMRAVYRLTVLARDGGGSDELAELKERGLQTYGSPDSTNPFHQVMNDQKVRTSATQVQITLTDVNDHYPIFVYPNASSYQVRVSMYEKKGFIITRLVAVDKDTGPNGQIRYGIIKGNQLGLFKVRPDTGELFLDRPLNAEHKGNMFLIVEASDKGTPRAQTNSLEIRLTITDEPAIGRKINMLDGTVSGKLRPFDMMAMENVDGDTSGTIELNKLIMMCIVISTAVVCVIMIFAIGIFVRRTSCHALLRSGGRRRRNPGRPMNGAPMNAERYTKTWETDSNGKPEGLEQTTDGKSITEHSKLQTVLDGSTDQAVQSVSLEYANSPKVPLLYDSVTGAKDATMTSYHFDEQTIPNRYVDLSHSSPGKLTFNSPPNSATSGFHLEQNDAVDGKPEYLVSQPTGMRLLRPGDTTLCAIHEDPSAGIQLVAIPMVSTDGSYIPLTHRPTCTLTDPKESCQQSFGRQLHLAHPHQLSAGLDPISMDSDADSGRGGSVNNIGLACPIDNPVSPTTDSLAMAGVTPATVHTLGVPVRYVSYAADGKLHMLNPPNTCGLSPQAVLVPISAVPDGASVTNKANTLTNLSSGHPSPPILTCVEKNATSVTHPLPSVTASNPTMASTAAISPSRRHDSSAGKKRDCGPWRLVQLPTQELEAEIQKY